MNENINLCDILKGHEGETFWSDVFDYIILEKIINDIIVIHWGNITLNLYSNGSKVSGERCIIFPSKDQRDWNKWIEENEHVVPKTWTELYNKEMADSYDLGKNGNFHVSLERFNSNEYLDNVTLIEKSALALLKINQLIEFGYGGNVTSEKWVSDKTKYIIIFNAVYNRFEVFASYTYTVFSNIVFNTKQQAEEFLSYPENVQLLKDYFMI